MLVKDAPFEDVVKYGQYSYIDGYKPFVCNMCGNRFSNLGEVLAHISIEHIEDELPEVDPTE